MAFLLLFFLKTWLKSTNKLHADVWLTGWSSRKMVIITAAEGDYADYQVLVNLDTKSLISSQKLKSDCSDIRFTDSDGFSKLFFWLESGCNSTSTKLWVKVPSIPNGSKEIYLYYGNPSAANENSGKDTFLFFDDFTSLSLGENPVLYTSQEWEGVRALRWGSIAEVNGVYYIYYTNGSPTTSDVGRATSLDLKNWTKFPNNPVINDIIGPSLLKELDGKTPVYFDSKYWMATMTSASPGIESKIQVRSSPVIDGNNWIVETDKTITPKAGTWYSSKVFTNSFVKEGNIFYIFFQGYDGTYWKIGYATATHPKGPYTVQGIVIQPTLSFEYKAVCDPEVRKFDGTYYLFYTTGGSKQPDSINTYAKSSLITGPYQKSSIIITPKGISYPAILKKDNMFYVLGDDLRPGGQKNLYKRSNLAGMFYEESKWVTEGSGKYSLSGGNLFLTNPAYISSLNSFPPGHAIRIRIKTGTDTVGYIWSGFSDIHGTSLSKNLTLALRRKNTDKYLTFSSGNGTNSQTLNYPSLIDTAYHIAEARRTNKFDKFQLDLTGEFTGSYPSSTSRYVDLNAYSADLVVDWVLVRKYLSPEPKVIIGK